MANVKLTFGLREIISRMYTKGETLVYAYNSYYDCYSWWMRRNTPGVLTGDVTIGDCHILTLWKIVELYKTDDGCYLYALTDLGRKLAEEDKDA